MADRNVVITGVGCVGPGFLDYPGLGSVMDHGVISCAPLARFDTKDCKTKLAFQVDQRAFANNNIDPIRKPLIVQYGDRVLAEALAMAGLVPGEGDPTCLFGTTVGGTWEMEAAFGSLERFAPGYKPVWSALDAASLAYPGELIFDPLHPKSLKVLTTGCTAGLDALGIGWMDIRAGADCAVVVSSEAPLGPLVVTSFDQINALTKETEDPLRASIPFGVNRSGFCIGEGAAALVLEEERAAKRRGARSLAMLRGYATTSSAYHMCAIHPEGEAIHAAVANALDVSGVAPKDVSLIVAHATSTKQNDVAEHAAFRKLFGEALLSIPIFAGKANFGHALGSSNLIETAAALRALQKGHVPAYPRKRERAMQFDDLFIPESETRLRGPIAIKNSSGFSGIHSAIVLEGSLA